MTELRKLSHDQVMDWKAPPDAMKRAFIDRIIEEMTFPCHRCGKVTRFLDTVIPLPTLSDREEIFHPYCSDHCAQGGCSSEYCEHPRSGEELEGEDV